MRNHTLQLTVKIPSERSVLALSESVLAVITKLKRQEWFKKHAGHLIWGGWATGGARHHAVRFILGAAYQTHAVRACPQVGEGALSASRRRGSVMALIRAPPAAPRRPHLLGLGRFVSRF